MWRILIQILERAKQLRNSKKGGMGTIEVLFRILCII